MKKSLFILLLNIFAVSAIAQSYTPTEENLRSRKEFADCKLGIFLHWGIYSTFAQGEWYLQNAVPDRYEYAKAADAFYPHRFNADEWVKAIKESGAKYICFTTRHHDGFSMWNTDESPYNICKATPFRRDVVGELADACHRQGIRLHLYYSHIDWGRDDYPMGRTGRHCGKDSLKSDWPHYYNFMNRQLTELLTRYGRIGAIWFDGWWDHERDTVSFNWQLPEQYALIHKLQPACLVGNNHHVEPFEGEDIQIFERDLPGENTTGFSPTGKAAEISRLPLETCQTMNGMWGYKVVDQDYKSVDEIIRLLVNTSGKGANLLLNIGPQPNGELPALALDRLKGLGAWMKVYGKTIYRTTAGPVLPQSWGATTQRGDSIFVHVTGDNVASVDIPLTSRKAVVTDYLTGSKVPFTKTKTGITITLPKDYVTPDYVVVVKVKK